MTGYLFASLLTQFQFLPYLLKYVPTVFQSFVLPPLPVILPPSHPPVHRT